MASKKVPAGIAALLLLLASCDYAPGAFKWVDYDLRGRWECTEEAPWPESQWWKKEKGTLVLDYDTITITGPVAHLRGFTRDIPLEAYTEEGEDGEPGLLYIRDRGVLQSPVGYRYWLSGGYPKVKMLTLTGGGAVDETFKRIEE
ncbi:MAG: hypothetical protein LBP76_04995 [Treponema sp.]|jgi:hypothetical protein|nr:hypothetical protein [Treponema sp.]